jgi:low molecular weight protein-tyrosine phosphatase
VSELLERSLAAVARRLERPAQWLLSRPPVRAWLRRRALRAWRDGDGPLILCYGNINRSAFAAALARTRDRAGARSAGFHPLEGRPSPEATIACAASYGTDLSAHRSRRVTRDELRAAGAVFVFDLENVARVAALDPVALAKTHPLGALDDDPHALIADPHGRGDAVLAATLARIARAVERAGSAARDR